MEISRNGSQPSRKGPGDFFTGSVRIDPLFEPKKITHAQGALVTFEPGAHTPWHTHSFGQTLIVVSGCGWAQSLGLPIVEIHPGDIIWFAPNEKHWHGATTTTAMSHISIVEHSDEQETGWIEKLSDEQYLAGKWPSKEEVSQ